MIHGIIQGILLMKIFLNCIEKETDKNVCPTKKIM